MQAWLDEHGVDRLDRDAVDAAVRERNAVRLAQRAATADRSALPAGSALRVTVRLLDVHPPVWRRFVVPADVTLDRLHAAVQSVMGWEDAHLHQWELGEDLFGTDLDVGELPEGSVRLVDLLGEGESLLYRYDFGDGWEHELRLDQILLPADAGEVPRCEAGRRACPPEDIGGAPGYEAFLEARADPTGASEDMLTLVEELAGFEPDAFSADHATSRLRHHR